MKKLYAPWRSNYLRPSAQSKQNSSQKECVFCQQFADHEDKKNFIIKRYKYSVIMLNAYPYNAGHILILPYEHADQFDKLTQETRAELMELISTSIKIVQTALGCDGINMGTNQGKAAGGSIPEHLHIHVLPRWLGDTNFLCALADTKPISFDLHKIYEQLVDAFKITESTTP